MKNRYFVLATMLIALSFLSACKDRNAWRDQRTGNPEISARSNCMLFCEGELARCGDTEAARRENQNPDFGAAAQCTASYRKCLNTCQ